MVIFIIKPLWFGICRITITIFVMTHPEQPEEEIGHEVFEPASWLGSRNTRDIFRVMRNTALSATREQLENIRPMLAACGGLCVFHTFADEAEYRILVTNRKEVTDPRNIVVSVNCERTPDANEPYFPDGRIMDLSDIVVPPTGKWLNTSYSTLSRRHHDKRWDSPDSGTILYIRNTSVTLYGHLHYGDFNPGPARDMQEVGEDAAALWSTCLALQHCTPTNLEEHVKTIKK